MHSSQTPVIITDKVTNTAAILIQVAEINWSICDKTRFCYYLQNCRFSCTIYFTSRREGSSPIAYEFNSAVYRGVVLKIELGDD